MTEQPWWHQDANGEHQGPQDAVGSAAEEAARLFSAMRDRFLSDRADRGVRRIDELFNQDLPVPASPRGHSRPDTPHSQPTRGI